MKRFFARAPWFPLVYAFLSAAALLSLVHFQAARVPVAPPDTVNTYVFGHIGDYYAYTYMIKRGAEGHLLWRNAFSDEKPPPVLIHPFYHLLGRMSVPFGTNPFITFYVSKLVSISLFLFAVFLLINRAVKPPAAKILAAIFFFTSTSFYSIQTSGTLAILTEPKLYTDYFNAFTKFCNIPPHHFLAFAGILWAILILLAPTRRIRDGVILALIAVAVGLLQPYVLFVFTLIILGITIQAALATKKIPNTTPYVLAFLTAGGLTMLGNYYLFSVLFRLPFAAVTIASGIRTIPLLTYLEALGPLVVLGALACLNASWGKRPYVNVLFWWAWLPILLFLLPDIGIPISSYRIFQMFQHVPLAILAALGVYWLGSLVTKPVIIVSIFAICSLVYGGVAGVITSKYILTTYVRPHFFNLFVPRYMTALFSYLNTQTEPDSILLAGEQLSNMLPTFTNVITPMGADSTNARFIEGQKDAYRFWSGEMSEEEVRTYLAKYHYRYIVFGVDAPSLGTLPYASYPLFKVIYTNGPITLVAVR